MRGVRGWVGAGALVVAGGAAWASLGDHRAWSAAARSAATPAQAGPLASAAPAPSRATPETLPSQDLESLNAPYDGKVHFVRIRYTPWGRQGMSFGRRGGREPMWAHDYPRGERNFMKIIDETTFIDGLVDGSNILTLDDPRLFQYPIAYIVEVGAWNPTDEEVEGLGTYLKKGGFLIVDDFRGSYDLQNLAFQLQRALPGAQLLELDASHGIFDSFFRIDPQQVIPPYGWGEGPPLWYGVFEENDREKRMLVVINANNDISEYWEYSDRGYYPIDLSNEAYKLGVNYLVYALTH